MKFSMNLSCNKNNGLQTECKKESTKTFKIKTVFVILFLLYCGNIYSQSNNDLKTWAEIRVSCKISPKVKVKFGQFFSFKTSPFEYNFSQTEIALSYKLKRRTYLEGGYIKGLFNDSKSLRKQGASPDLFNTLAVQRIFVKFSYKHNVAERLTLRHKFEYHYFFPELKKYKTRIVYSARLSYHIRRSSLTPFIETRGYFYRGGEISNGLKRIRLKTGLRFNPIKNFPMRTSIYVLFQNEFNTEQLSDNDFTVIGTTISFKIK